jgi:molybdopterin-synthase adenylyltransferase
MPDEAATDLRYARHHALPEIGEAGQARLGQSRALIIGMGGLGCAAAQYLAASGIGSLCINDFDDVDASNLSRQLLYREQDVGRRKVEAAAEALRGLNPALAVHRLPERLGAAGLRAAAAEVDVVLDGSDNFGTRFAVNRACVAEGVPLVSGAAIRWQGQLFVTDTDHEGTPCYACLYAEEDETLEDCAGAGVASSLVGIVGARMALETTKVLLDLHRPSLGRLQVFDGLDGSWKEHTVPADPGCSICGREDHR